MKKYQFSLEKLRAYKKQMMERERNKLLALRNERNQTEAYLHQLIDEQAQAQARFEQMMQIGTDVRTIARFQILKDANLNEQHALRLELRTMDAGIERQRRIVVRVSQEVSGLDKLEEEQRTEYQRLAAKESETMLEEFLSFRMLHGDTESQSN